MDCKCPIFEYLGGHHLRPDNKIGQLHRCIDCGRKEGEVPAGSVMVGHAPGECSVCDEEAKKLPPKQKERWIRLTEEDRSEI